MNGGSISSRLKTGINDLCNELLLLIFSHFTAYELAMSVSGVCSRWRELINHNNFMWKHLWLPWDILPDDHNYAAIVQSIPNLQCLRLYANSLIEVNDSLSFYLSQSPNLEKLDLMTNVNNITLLIINTHLPYLKYLRVNQLVQISPEDIATLKNITTLKINHAYNFCGNHLRKLASECTFLSALSVVNAMSLRESDVLYLIEHRKLTLERLKISGYGMSDTVLYGIAQCQNIKYIYIDDARLITKQGIMAVSGLPHLKVLYLSRLKLSKEQRVSVLLCTRHVKDVRLPEMC